MKNTKKVVTLLLTMMLFVFTSNVFAQTVHEGDKTITGFNSIGYTLVVKGDLIMEGNASIHLLAAGRLIITGNLYVANEIKLFGGAKLVVGGNVEAENDATLKDAVLKSRFYTIGNVDSKLVVEEKITTGGAAELAANDSDLMTKLQEHSKLELVSFEATAYEGYNELKWSTSLGSKAAYFTLEKSIDNITWDSLSVVSAQQTTHQFTDTIDVDGKVHYRLKQTYVGKTETMKVISVESKAVVETVLAGFEAIAYEGYNELIWATYSESNVDYFTIEKSIDSLTWGSLVVKNTTQQTTTDTTEYGFTDTIIESGKVYYRLTKTDSVGVTDTMKVISVESKAVVKTVLVSFEAIAYKGYNDLKWATSSEYDVDWFIIYKSDDGVNWNPWEQTSSINGTSISTSEYTEKDEEVEFSKIFYKLAFVNTSGEETTLEIIEIENNLGTSIDNVSESIFNSNEKQTIVVTSLDGKTLYKDDFDGTEETYNEIIKSLPKGVSVLTIQSDSRTVSQKIVK